MIYVEETEKDIIHISHGNLNLFKHLIKSPHMTRLPLVHTTSSRADQTNKG